MHEAQRRLLAQAVPRLRRSQADGGEGRLDGVRRPKTPPVRRREVVEGEQLLAVPRQAIGGFRVLRLPGGTEALKSLLRMRTGVRPPYLVQHRLRFALNPFGQPVEHVRRLVHPAALRTGFGIYLGQGRPQPQPTVAHRQLRRPHAPVPQAQQHRLQLSFDSLNPDSRARKRLRPRASQPTTTSRQRRSSPRTFT